MIAAQAPTVAPDPFPPILNALPRDQVFLSYQASTVALSHAVPLLVVEKSRRIGITWGFAGDDAITAATDKAGGGDDVLYIGPSLDMAREYIDAVAAFARAFMSIDATVGETMFADEDLTRPGETRQIKAFRIDFASGFHVLALTSAPRSLRGRQGRVRIDEAAFVDNLAELLKAALALLIWGGQVTVMSTHNGVDNEFNQLIQRIRSGEQAGQVVRITFDDAVEAGLYERVCLVSGRQPTPEGKAKWVAEIRAFYGSGASEELDVIPARGGGSWLSFDEIERAEREAIPVVRWELDDAFGRKPDLVRELQARLWCEEVLAPLVEALDPRAPIGVGGDFARRVDLTDIWLLQELQDRSWTTPFLIELRNVPITEQIFILRWLFERLRF
jgi:phage FluMu gp28-like protein